MTPVPGNVRAKRIWRGSRSVGFGKVGFGWLNEMEELRQAAKAVE
jgi:hypothetical protein